MEQGCSPTSLLLLKERRQIPSTWHCQSQSTGQVTHQPSLQEYYLAKGDPRVFQDDLSQTPRDQHWLQAFCAQTHISAPLVR